MHQQLEVFCKLFVVLSHSVLANICRPSDTVQLNKNCNVSFCCHSLHALYLFICTPLAYTTKLFDTALVMILVNITRLQLVHTFVTLINNDEILNFLSLKIPTTTSQVTLQLRIINSTNQRNGTQLPLERISWNTQPLSPEKFALLRPLTKRTILNTLFDLKHSL